jgi:hypothetical protein
MSQTAAKLAAPQFVLLDQNGILNPCGVQALSDHLFNFVDDLVEHGEARDQSVTGLKWVLVGLGFQIAGSLPLPL